MNRRSFLELDSSDEESEEELPDPPYYKLIVLGAEGIGKTSFIKRITRNTFTLTYTPTRNIEIYSNNTYNNMDFECWDIPYNICKYYNINCLDSDAVILMFNNQKTLVQVESLWKKLYKALYKERTPQMWVVGKIHIDPSLVDICPPERLFFIDNMSREGIDELMNDIKFTLNSIT